MRTGFRQRKMAASEQFETSDDRRPVTHVDENAAASH
jgi:hypothetical protein